MDLTYNAHWNAYEMLKLHTEYYYSNCATGKYILHKNETMYQT